MEITLVPGVIERWNHAVWYAQYFHKFPLVFVCLDSTKRHFCICIIVDFIKNWHKYFTQKAHNGKIKLWPTYPSFALKFLLTIFDIQFFYRELNESKRIQSQNSSAMNLQLTKDRLVWNGKYQISLFYLTPMMLMSLWLHDSAIFLWQTHLSDPE